MPKDNDCDVDRAKDSQFMRLLEQTTLSLQECAAVNMSIDQTKGHILDLH